MDSKTELSQCILDSGRAALLDRVSRCSQGSGSGATGFNLWFFTDDVVLLAPLGQDLQHVLGWFPAKCEAAGMRVSTCKSEAMVLDLKKGG